MSNRVRASVLALTAAGIAAAVACGGSASNDDGATARDGGAPPPVVDAAPGTDAAIAHDAAPTCSPDVRTDPKNCGSCRHDCLGSPCLAGQCVPVVVAGSLDSPAAIALDATHVYWQSEKNGLVFRVAKAGGATEPLTSAPVDSQALARPQLYVDATHVYFTNNDKQAVQRVPLAGGPAETVVTLLNQVPTFTADADTIYVGAGSFYAAATLYRTKKNAPQVSTAMGDVFGLVSLAVDDTTLYWTEIEGVTAATSGSVRAISKTSTADAGAPTVLADKQGNPTSITVGAQVYWGNTDTGAVKTVSKAGGAAVSIAAAQFQPASIAIDAANIYWINLGNGKVMTCPLAGCSAGPRALAVDQASPTSLAVDDTAVYWTAKTGGAVMKVAK